MPTYKLRGTDYIYERISTDGRLTSYQVKIRRKGFPNHTGSFDDLEEAKRFVRQVMGDQDRGHKIDRLIGHRTSVGDVIDDAITALETGRRRVKGKETELYRLRAFKRDFVLLCSTALADASEDMFEDWIAERLEEVKPNSIGRDVRLLKPIFEAAARKYDLARSPLAYIKPPRSIDERIRRIQPEEEELLFAELIAAQDPIVPLAAQFALETGCRRSKMLRLEWPDYDAQGGTIWLADAKNGRGRFLLLTETAQKIVESLPARAQGGKVFKASGNQLKKAFEQARARAAKRAEALGRPDLVSVGTLRWHDFRHEAVSRCFDAGWTSEQVMDFSGHVDVKSLLRYRHSKVDESVARLRALKKPRATSVTVLPGTLDGRVVEDHASIDS
ncbi:tyrosine-type recombinase/integrase [Devosia faecipullorum]|uniref:tyrosine-type recombinase/integrase n=1 Tax=Devosia faecipullorum TaxID=2755039 RepID=UPI00187B4460|nr:site-specific integrase [Devosia faecipullorum]MBE7734508.1 tyrosine-type recombinase/integrase [Devosia faecipullorum]